MSTAKRLREARERAGLSQRDLAVKAGLSNAYVNMVERGDDPDAENVIRSPSNASLAKLAEALGVRVEWLAFGSGPVVDDQGAA